MIENQVKFHSRHGEHGWQTWRRWVFANVLGEVVGFGLAAVAAAAAAEVVGALVGALQLVAAIGAVIVIGTVEGAAVGLAQWSVLRAYLPSLSRRSWTVATVAGAIVAWGAGMLVGTLASNWGLDGATAFSSTVVSVVIGLIAGTLLALGQWWILRRVVQRAAWWLLANALGWAAGMIVAFAGVSATPEDAGAAVIATIGAITGLAMGATVAAITGVALVWLLRQE